MTTGTKSEDRLKSVVKPWKSQARKEYVLTNARVIDSEKGIVTENATVHLSNGTIKSINGDQRAWAGNPAITTLDLKAAVPGEFSLQDTFNTSENVSLLRQPFVCKAMLDRGFTTVRDTGGASLALKEAIEDELHPGPRLFIAGHALSQTGGHADIRSAHDSRKCCGGRGSAMDLGRVMDGVPECLRAARDEIRQGADFIKIMRGGGVASPTDLIEHVQFSDEEIRAFVTVARNAGTYVTSHAYTPQAIQQSIRQGVSCIEHGNLIDDETAKIMAETGTFLVPTLVAYSIMAGEDIKEFGSFLPPSGQKKNREVLVKGLDALKLATDTGVKVCSGTDLLGSMTYAQSQEFSLRAKVLPAKDILLSATVTAAKLLRQEHFLGKIEEGFAADILLLNANPLDNNTILDRPAEHLLATIKDGRVVSSRWEKLKPDNESGAKMLTI